MQESIRIDKPFTYHKGTECSPGGSRDGGGMRHHQQEPISSSTVSKHNRFITPQNIDNLILKLNKMEVNQVATVPVPSPCSAQLTPRGGGSQQHCSSTLYSSHNKKSIFTDRFIHQLPTDDKDNTGVKTSSNWKQKSRPADTHSNPKRLQTRLAPIDTTKLSGASPVTTSTVYPYRSHTVDTHPLSLMDLLKRTNPLTVEATPIKPAPPSRNNSLSINDKLSSIGSQ